ncbi:hypothetical protein [Phytoactinopolyspora halotolerans]|uniref:Uncharacterized protein n=1 Tax=Phytoactinopolyspora halotolerans TaxID=1981512 RepID=A0A6L9SK68_9ACTN|nr:hypothetical protein [Phytoactinopolyspora halotolerans]NEE04490.1 hypothetical protein [Phytoactinopolyspora halotolerans]
MTAWTPRIAKDDDASHPYSVEKGIEDWECLPAVVVENDHAGHLISIHNCLDFYDYSKPWITHASMQRIDVYRARSPSSYSAGSTWRSALRRRSRPPTSPHHECRRRPARVAFPSVGGGYLCR